MTATGSCRPRTAPTATMSRPCTGTMSPRNSYLIIATLLGTLFVGFYSGFSGVNATPQYAYSDPGTGFDWVYQNIYSTLSSTMFSMLAFFVGSASYRAFRARNLHATLLLISGF